MAWVEMRAYRTATRPSVRRHPQHQPATRVQGHTLPTRASEVLLALVQVGCKIEFVWKVTQQFNRNDNKPCTRSML